jgi:multiple sugar transport system permease protein
VLVTPFVLIVGLFLIVPALCGFAASFTNYAPFQADIRFVGLENYSRLVQDTSFQASIRNTVVFTVVTVLLDLILGIGLSYLLRDGFRGRAVLRLLLLVPWLISPIAAGIMWHFVAGLNHGFLNYIGATLGLPDLPFPFT